MKSATLPNTERAGADLGDGAAAPATDERGAAAAEESLPRLGFLGTGWIGRHRMEAVLRSGVGRVSMICDPSEEMVAEAAAVVPEAEIAASFEHMLFAGLDGIVIATPSALHAEQAVAALESGAAVFCQKPLGRSERETAWVVGTARAADLLLGVDLSYRFTAGMQLIRDAIRGGEIGQVFAADLVFHNAYGPDKGWFYDVGRSGGGCVMDLGIHLVDLALWALDFPEVEAVGSRLFAEGRPLPARPSVVEDYAVARLDLAGGGVVQMACSWRLPVGQDARIEASFYGTGGGVRMRNVDGSFYDLTAERFHGTRTELLTAPPDEWGGRAAVNWAKQLAAGARFDAGAERLVPVARVLDAIYGR
jgi:predicted dehydrogenase